jgi:hypothetical protein
MSRISTVICAGLLAVAAAAPAGAVSVHDCDDYISSIQALAEPWEKNTRTFLNGAVRVALVDTGGEPVCCSMHLVVLSEDRNQQGGGDGSRICKVISNEERMGFMMMDVSAIKASYNPARGLDLAVPYKLYIDGLQSRPGVARINVNLARGTISAR